jgi:hypothetical protein
VASTEVLVVVALAQLAQIGMAQPIQAVVEMVCSIRLVELLLTTVAVAVAVHGQRKVAQVA